jgi:transposase
MPYQIAGIDVHKKMLAVVVADVEVEGEYRFERQKVGTSPAQLRALADWLVEREVEEVMLESTAQYWRPVWEAIGAPLEAEASGARACHPDVRHAPSRAGAVESWGWRTEEGFPGRRTLGEAPGRPRADLKLCARRRATPLADGHAPQVFA